jgi:spermidine synthase
MPDPETIPPVRRAFWLVTTFLTGLVVMALELVAFRLYAPHFGYSQYVWGAMIGVVLVALTLGYALGGRLADRSAKGGAVDETPLFVAITVSAIYQAAILGVAIPLLEWCATLGTRSGPLVATLLVFTVPMSLLAMTGPYVTRLLAKDVQLGATVGNVSALSTVGSIVGVFGTSFLVIPSFGTRATLVACAVLTALIGLAGLAMRRKKSAALAIVPFVLLPALPGFGWSDGTIYLRESEYNLVRVFEHDGERFLSLNEQRTAQTIRPVEGGLGGRYFDFFLYGPLYASGHRTLVLGMGAGASVWATRIAAPDAEIDAVEIDPDVVEAARRYFDLPSDDRFRAHVADARAYLREAHGPYDVVHVDLYQGGMYQPFYLVTREAFAEVRALMNDDGVMVMNVYDGSTSHVLLSTIARTIRTSFASVHVIHAGRRNHILFAFPRETSLAEVAARISRNARGEGVPRDAAAFANKPDLDFEALEIPDDATVLTDDLAPVEEITSQMIEEMRAADAERAAHPPAPAG